MSSTYEKINYALRPAKGIERKMLAEAFSRLAPFERLSSYRYIGFGSTYFSDFIAVHRSLGLKKMISIEKEAENADRFNFNRPYCCIDLKFGESGEILPVIPWQDNTILWLDYDGQLNSSVLADIGTFCSRAASGSLLVVTVNAHPDKIINVEEVAAQRLRKLEEAVGRDKIPEGVQGRDLRGWGKASVCWRIITNEIKQVLTARNGALSKQDRFQYKQLFNFNYKDNAMMLTVGGIIFTNSDNDRFKRCHFKDLSFVKTSKFSYLIDVPCLTHREIRYLDRQLPRKKNKRLAVPAVKHEDIKKYERIYRYFPTFTEAEI